jgi:hypothetical protein
MRNHGIDVLVCLVRIRRVAQVSEQRTKVPVHAVL